MHHLVDANGARLFPPRLRLLSHWNLRDEIKADYSRRGDGLAKQRDDRQGDGADRDADDSRRRRRQPAASTGIRSTNEVRATTDKDSDAPPPPAKKPLNEPEPDTRYAKLLARLPRRAAGRRLLPDRADADRAPFRGGPADPRGAREEDARGCAGLADACRDVAELVEKRLGRQARAVRHLVRRLSRPRRLFGGGARRDRAQAISRPRRPIRRTSRACLRELGFSPERAVDAGREHRRRSGARLRATRWARRGAGDKAHLRTRVEKDGMNYKGFNIAVHEMGHNVEQTLLAEHDRSHAAPGRAEHRVHRGAGVRLPGPRSGAAGPRQADRRGEGDEDARTTSGPATRSPAWRWWTWASGIGCTTHPDATPAELKDATIAIAKDVWNRYYAAVFGDEGRRAARRLLAHDRLDALPARLSDRPHDRFPDRAADGKGGSDRARVRAHGDARATSLRISGWRKRPARPSAPRRCSPRRARRSESFNRSRLQTGKRETIARIRGSTLTSCQPLA